MASGFMRLLFGYDIYISYAHRDGTVYAARLAERLTALGYSCFLDLSLAPGESLRSRVFRVLQLSRVLVVVASPAALTSATVAEEIHFYRRSRRGALIIIDFHGTLEEAVWYESVQGLIVSREPEGNLIDGRPNEELLQHIKASIFYLRRTAAIRQLIMATALGVPFLIVGGLVWAISTLNMSFSTFPTTDSVISPGWGLCGLLMLISFAGGSLLSLLWGRQNKAKRSDNARGVVLEVEEAGTSAFLRPFLSYSHSDRAFVVELELALRDVGIRCWLDEKDLMVGDDIHEAVQKAIEELDKFLLCCSKNSLESWWVDNELGAAFQREETLSRKQKDPVRLVIPLNLDNTLFSDDWSSGYKSQLRRRKAVDFTAWQHSRQIHKEELNKLVHALTV